MLRRGMLLAFTASAAACVNEAELTDSELTERIWEQLDGYQDWNQTPDWTGVQYSWRGAHGPAVQIWYDGRARSGVEQGKDYANGSMLVKEAYNDPEGTQLASVTVLKKIDGYDPEHNDWFFAVYDPATGESAASGKVDFCISCHEAAEHDYVMFTEAPPADEPPSDDEEPEDTAAPGCDGPSCGGCDGPSCGE